ncbi:MAG: adenylate kinase [Armatimonadetes bacterium]|nr:adenylate kinase [Armatimonadota bacterium]
MRLILVGPPGVGKGTQAALIQERLGPIAISSGDIFRAELRNETELGTLAQGYMERGELVPDDIVIRMISGRLQQPDVSKGGFLLDGFPRTVPQAEALDGILDVSGMEIEAVISMEVDDQVVVDRLGKRRSCPNCGEVYHLESRPPEVDGICDRCKHELIIREDDRPETIIRRLAVFRESTLPVVNYYEQRGILRRINAGLAQEDVYAQIAKAVRA